MLSYFGYGSNINLTSLRSKGVEPISSVRGRLPQWQLKFNVQHWFTHEGGVGNIVPSSDPNDFVEGIVHLCKDEHLASLDAVESYGIGYDRVLVNVETEKGLVQAYTYVGLPGYLNDACLPTQRYLNIIIKGAEDAGLSEDYIDRLRRHPIFVPDEYPPFQFPDNDLPVFTTQTLATHPKLTALGEFVFDMQHVSPRLECLIDLFGGKDMTLFHVKRHDTSTGLETIEDVRGGTITESAKNYLNAYLHEYAREFRLAGRFRY